MFTCLLTKLSTKTKQFRMHKKPLTLDVSKHERKVSNMFANNLSSIYAYKHTYFQTTKKRDIKKRKKNRFQTHILTNIQTVLYKRETEAQ